MVSAGKTVRSMCLRQSKAMGLKKILKKKKGSFTWVKEEGRSVQKTDKKKRSSQRPRPAGRGRESAPENISGSWKKSSGQKKNCLTSKGSSINSEDSRKKKQSLS